MDSDPAAAVVVTRMRAISLPRWGDAMVTIEGLDTPVAPRRFRSSADVERYVRGIDRRLDKLPADHRKDEAKLQDVLAVEDDHAKLLAALRPSQVTKRVVEVGWALEELRVATFAESLGTKAPTSPKRITKELDALFAGDLW